RGLPYESTMFRDEFMDATLDMWEIPPESAKRVGHPAPFPVALPQRLISLFTYQGDLVLDPFMGSGTTAVAAVQTGRHFVGYDTDATYVRNAQERLAALSAQPISIPAVPSALVRQENWLEQSHSEGAAAKEVARRMLVLAGFDKHGPIIQGAKAVGIEFSFSVLDATGRQLLIDFFGAFSASRPGLKRSENLFRSLGKASALSLLLSQQVGQLIDPQLVLMSTDAPTKRSIQGRALSAALQLGHGTIAEVVLLEEQGLVTLKQLAMGLRPGEIGWVGSNWTETYG
ncbi:MAG: site-specific DNA-methyltransferase, partial [Microthrixaceae bacterium]